jgi:hypothetical protein
MSTQPYIISDKNLSHAWGRALWHIARTPGCSDISPLIISIDGFDENSQPLEDNDIRGSLDNFLAARKKWSVEIVAFTIFPERYLRISGGNRAAFYEICFDALPHLKARNPHLNGRGMYFERLMKFGRGRINDNQLEFILDEYLAGRPRTSKFQACIFDPERDQSRQPYQTFPCLQTVTFVPTDDGLIVNAVYAMQYLVQRGYGNFLGLANLGAFMAREMKLPMARLNVIAGVEKLDFPKSAVVPLIDVVRQKIANLDPAPVAAAA